MKIIKYLLGTFLSLLLILIVGNFSYAKDYEYKSLDILADVKTDGTIDVTETFITKFLEHKHGIIRIIPLNYTVEGKAFHIDISDVHVAGNNFTKKNNDGELEIKIGDPNKTVIGENIYSIFYSTYGLIKNFSGMGYSELYWNVVGYDFDTNIDSVRVEIDLPKKYSFSDDDFLITVDGRETSVGRFEGKVDWNQGDKIIITYNKTLNAYHGITLAIKFPNDYFKFNHKKQASLVGYIGGNFSSLDFEWSWLFFIIPGFLLILWFVRTSGNKPEIQKSEIESQLSKENPIVVRYTPPEGINCAEAGMLYNCLLEPTDLTSLLYKWAIEGLISIEIDNDTSGFSTVRRFVMTKLKDIESNSPQYEKDFFHALLPGTINSKKRLSTTSEFDIVWSLKSLRNYGKNKGWLTVGYFEDGNLKKCIGFVGAIILFFFLYKIEVNVGIAGCISIFIFLIFNADSYSSPTQKKISLTDEGKKIALEIIGYAYFLKACDENKIRLFLKQDPAFFDKTLPYAVAFGFETLFINKITPILRELDIRPVRYNGEMNDLDYFSRVVRDMVRTQELRRKKERELRSKYDRSSGFSSGSSFSFGGGGFSAGGGGGGGGSRSW